MINGYQHASDWEVTKWEKFRHFLHYMFKRKKRTIQTGTIEFAKPAWWKRVFGKKYTYLIHVLEGGESKTYSHTYRLRKKHVKMLWPLTIKGLSMRQAIVSGDFSNMTEEEALVVIGSESFGLESDE